MKYLIRSPKYVKRSKWFINDEYGIGFIFMWANTTCQVIVDTKYLEEDCESEWEDLINPFIGKDFSPDDDSQELSIDYPSPWFLTEPSKSCIWETPTVATEINENFKLILNTNYIYDKGVQLSKLGKKNYWSTLDNEFKWRTADKVPYAHQKNDEFTLLAEVFSSNAWVSEGKLEEYLEGNFKLTLDEDTFTFYAPSIRKKK